MKLINTKIKNDSIFFSTQIPIVMGILNLTTDSFYDGGNYLTDEKIILKVKTMLDEGASIIDIGAQSSKPGAIQISSKEELKKILPTIKLLKSKFKNIIISVDTFWSNTAKQSVLKGANIINDISAGEIDENMLRTIAKLNVPYIMMHMQGTPEIMQDNPQYNNVTLEIMNFFKHKISNLSKLGFNKIIIDPGFGFGKTIQHNYQLLNNLTQFKNLKKPILVGLSRKSMIYKLLDIETDKALNGTSIINTLALQNGANILRVHDVKEAIECIKITTFAKNTC
tara:strand:+ start:1709 stop:2554 length:846 start_codon:yes stop_codon:yes gene_type:complete